MKRANPSRDGDAKLPVLERKSKIAELPVNGLAMNFEKFHQEVL